MPYLNGEIAFDFMENYIEEVKRIHILVIKDRAKHKIEKCEEINKHNGSNA